MIKTWVLSILVLVLSCIGVGGCRAAQATQMPTSLPIPFDTPTVTPPTVTPISSTSLTTASQWPVFEGQYLGQKKPGLTPEPFAPDVFSDDGHLGYHLHTSVYFSPDGQQVFFTHQTLEPLQLTIMFTKQENGVWRQPQVAPFSGTYDDNCAAFSAHGQRLYFTSNRPLSEGGEPAEESSIWFVERTNADWSAPRHVDSPIDIDRDEGPLYFAILESGRGSYDVYRSRFADADGRYTLPENLGEPINTGLSEYAVLTAPDERFLIFYRFGRSNKADPGLYLSFHRPDDSWTQPVHLDDKLDLDFGFDASMSPDGEYLFLLDRGVGVYWVDADAIELFRTQ